MTVNPKRDDSTPLGLGPSEGCEDFELGIAEEANIGICRTPGASAGARSHLDLCRRVALPPTASRPAFSPLIIAHRGGRYWEGKKFSHIRQSVNEGADVIELDVRMRYGTYVIQHGAWEGIQGSLQEALKTLGTCALYVDLKSNEIEINRLIDFIRSRHQNPLIIGSFSPGLLRSIGDPSVTKCLHCLWRRGWRSDAEIAKAHWISPICYSVTKSFAFSIRSAGFRFVPSGNLIFKRIENFSNQLRFSDYGAYAISTHHVREMKRALRIHQLNQLQ